MMGICFRENFKAILSQLPLGIYKRLQTLKNCSYTAHRLYTYILIKTVHNLLNRYVIPL